MISSSHLENITELTSAGLCDVGTSAPLLGGRRRGGVVARSSGGDPPETSANDGAQSKTAKIAIAAAVTTVLAVANRVLYKVALVSSGIASHYKPD
jgi:hypothetical protein